MKRGGLGRGLSALIPGADERSTYLEVPIDSVSPNPKQPRSEFDGGSLEALAGSIREVGVLQPIVIRARGMGYELVAGERRLRAARMAGLATVPAVIRETADADTLREALIENIHREDLGPLELAAALEVLLGEPGATHETVAQRVGFSRAHVVNTIRLLDLPPDVQRLLSEGRIQAGHARALLALEDDEARSALALRIAAEGSSVREVERLVKTYSAPTSKPPSHTAARDAMLAPVEELLSERLATRVQVTMGKRKGRIVVEFGSADDLQRLVEAITGSPSDERSLAEPGSAAADGIR